MSRRERGLLLAIGVVALGLRVWYLASQRDDVLFEHPILDEQRYLDSAIQGEARAYWQPPGVIYVIALARVVAVSLWWPRLLQALVGAASCLVLFALARRWFSTHIALAAAAVLALHGVAIYECWELLPATWIVFFDLLALLLLVEKRALSAGLALGVSALFSPLILPLAAVAAAWLRRPRAIALLLLGVMLPIAPVTARNYAHGGELVLISTNGGLNLYLGNNQHYAETFALRPGRHWEELTNEPLRHGIDAPGAASRYFTHRALGFVAAHPLQAAGLYLRKLYLYFNGAEIARDSDILAARSGILKLLVWPWHFPDGLLLPLALLGAAFTRRSLLHLFLALQALFTAAFFVSARHRLPSIGVFALFAVVGAVELWRRRTQIWPLGLWVLLLVALNLPTREASISLAAERDFYRGVALLREEHDPLRATEYFRTAANANPQDARAWFELGNSLDLLHRRDEAVAAWQRAAEADPWDSRARRRAATVLMASGDLDGAIGVLRAHLEARLREPAHYAPDWLNLAFLLARRGRLDEARAAADAARQADPSYFAAHASGLPLDVKSALGLQP